MRGSIQAGLALALLFGAGVAEAEPVVLSNGDVLDAVSAERTTEGWLIEHAVLGTLLLEADRVARVGPEPEPAVDLAAEPPSEIGAGAFGTGWLVDFDRAFSLGATGARGNSENLEASAGLDLDFENETKRWKFDGRFYYSESAGEQTKNQAYVDLTRDWLQPDERRFYFGHLRWDVDEFEDWDHRGSLGGGVGWNLASDEDFSLRARTGLAATRTFGGVDDEVDFELLLRLESDWRPTAYQNVQAGSALYPSIRSPGEFRVLTGVTWKIALADTEGLAFQLGLDHEYESEVPRGTDRNDLVYHGSLVVDF